MDDFVFCIVCLSPRDMSADGLVEKCEYCGDDEYIRSDFYVPDGKPFYGYIEPNKTCSRRVQGCGAKKYYSKSKVRVGRTRG